MFWRFNIKVLDSALLLTLVTVFLYCSSTAYNHGYLTSMSLDSDILDRNFHQILYDGMIKNIWTFLLVPLFLSLLYTLHSIYKIELKRYVRKGFSNARKLLVLQKKLRIRNGRLTEFEVWYFLRIKYCWSFVVLLFAFFFSMAYFESEGKDKAMGLKMAIFKGKANNLTLPKYPDKKLIILFCGARNCAAIDQKMMEIVYFPQTESFTISNNSVIEVR